MKNRFVVVPTIEKLIRPSPGFKKKELSDFKLDLLALCGFGCTCCSSNAGNYLRIHREEFANLTEQQLGARTYPSQDPSLTFIWPDVIEKLKTELSSRRKSWGEGKTLVFSMLTDRRKKRGRFAAKAAVRSFACPAIPLPKTLE